MQFTFRIGKLDENFTFDTRPLFNSDEDSAAFDTIIRRNPRLMYPFEYGFRQSANDAHANIARLADGSVDEDIREAVADKVDSIVTGKVSTRTVGPRGPSVDPITREAIKLAKIWVKSRQKKDAAALKKEVAAIVADNGVAADVALGIIVANRAAVPSVRAKAAAIVAAMELDEDTEAELDDAAEEVVDNLDAAE